MKKIVLLLISIVTFIGIANAEEYIFNFRSKKTYAPESLNVLYKGGYVFIDSTAPRRSGADGYITYFDSNGKLLKSKEVFGKVYYYLVTDGEYLYAFGEERDTNFFVYHFIYKLNDNLDIVKSIEIENFESFVYYGSYRSNGVDVGDQKLILKDNKLKLLGYSVDGESSKKGLVCSIDLDLTNYSCSRIEETNDFLDRQKSYQIIDSYMTDNYNIFFETESMDNGYLLSISEETIACNESNYNGGGNPLEFLGIPGCRLIANLSYYDKDNNKKWNKVFDKYEYIDNIRVTKKHIVAIGVVSMGDGMDDHGTSEVIILDHQGNLVQVIPGTNNVFRLEADDSSLVFYSLDYVTCLGSFPYDAQECTNNGTHEVYSLEYEIETKVTEGKGKVEAIRTSKAGESVTFVVTPDEGYILGEVKVTDKDGNVIIFKENTFTMPSADVLVEATFLVKNAETKDIAIALIAMLAILTMIITIFESKKLKKVGV